jgi:serine protease
MAYRCELKVSDLRIWVRLTIVLLSFAGITACGGGGGDSNTAPVAIAGSAQTVDAQASVTLDGSDSTDPDGNIDSFRWLQTAGPSVTLSNIAIAAPRFTAPDVSSDTLLTFQLTVTDNNGSTDSATVSVTVRAIITFTLSGIVSAPAVVAVDSDTNDPLAPQPVSNDTLGEAQLISNPITLGGYVNVPNSGEPGRSRLSGDVDDYYRVELLAGQTITMLVADFQTADVDLFLYDSSGQFIAASVNVGEVESLIVPADDEYFVNPFAFSGASNYVLVIGSNAITGTHDGLSTSSEFVPGQAVVRYNDSLVVKQGLAVDSLVSQRGFSVRAGAPGRQMLLKLDTHPASPAATQNKGDRGGVKEVPFRNAKDRAKWETLMAIKALRQDPLVKYAEPNYILKATAIPNDEAYTAQWHYPLINLPAAWDLTTGNPNVIVAVIDTGVLFNHPDLQGQFIPGYDFISSTANSSDGDGIDPNPADPGDGGGQPSSFHGTHVSGTVAAASDNGIGGAGVAWNAKIMPLRVLGIGGGTSFDISQAVLYAAGLPNVSGTVPLQRADVINLSLGGPGFSQASQDTYTAARNAGVVIVAAAGNEATSIPLYPASYDGVISVSAVDAVRQLAPYSSFGPTIDVAAPGGDMRFDRNADGFPDGVLSTGGDDSSGSISFVYSFLNGTSMASPHVAGVIALMKSVNGNLTPAIIDQELALGNLTDDIAGDGPNIRNNSFGYGLINAQKAVTRALILDNSPPPDNPILGVSPTSLNFDAATDRFEITAQNVGTGNLQLVSTTPGEPWITITPTANVGNDGLGTYLVTVDRISLNLPDGIFSSQITLQSDANTVNIFVIMSVGEAGIGGDVGFIYLLLVDADSGETINVVTPPVMNGAYTYSFSNVAAGAYKLIAGTDADNDFTICDAGEACGAYLTIDQPIQLNVNGNQSDLNFPIGYIVALPALTATDDKTKNLSRALSRVKDRPSKAVAQ